MDLVDLPPTAFVVKIVDTDSYNLAKDNYISNNNYLEKLKQRILSIESVRSDTRGDFLKNSEPELFDDNYLQGLQENLSTIVEIQTVLKKELESKNYPNIDFVEHKKSWNFQFLITDNVDYNAKIIRIIFSTIITGIIFVVIFMLLSGRI